MFKRRPKNLIELAQSSVSIASVNSAMSGIPGSEARLERYLESVARSFGLATRRLPVEGYGENLLVTYEASAGEPWLLFDSHVDTVPTTGMTIDPLDSELHDGKLWGRGACDTKGSGAAMLWALREHARSGTRNVAILYSVDEESGMRGMRSFLKEDLGTLGMSIRGVIVGEPTRLRAIVAHNGVYRFRITTKGVAAHASNPSAGRSAISAMAKIIARIEEHYIPGITAAHPLTGKSACSINLISGGAAWNVVADRCEIQVDRRLVPGEVPDGVLSGFVEELAAIKREHAEIDYALDPTFEAPPLSPEGSDAFFPTVARALERNSLPADRCGVTYATHAGDLAAAGIPSVVIGPGDIAQAHTADEWVALAELELASRLYLDLMRSE